jgi:hypothetical protein
MPIVQVQEKLENLVQNYPGSPRLGFAIYEIVESFNTIIYYKDSILREHGTIGDQVFSLSSEKISENFELTRKNHQLFRSLQENLAKICSRETWISADDHVLSLANAEGGHLTCIPEMIFKSESMLKATVGIISEVNRQVDHIILMGTRWVEPLVKVDPEKRLAEKIIKAIDYWLEESDQTVTLQSILKIPVDSDLVDGVYTFFRQLKLSQFNARSVLQINTDPKMINYFDPPEKVLIVGDNTWQSFFLNNNYVSVFLTNTKSENNIDFSLPLDDQSGIKYLKSATYNLATDYGCGVWKSGYVSGVGIHQAITATAWDNAENQFGNLARTTILKNNQDPVERYHNHYIFIHSQDGERKKIAKMQPKRRLVVT